MTAEVEVRVRRCTVRVRRPRGWAAGWSRARSADEVLERLLPALEALLVAAVRDAGIGPDDDVVLAAPVVLEVGRDGTLRAGEPLAARLAARRPRPADPSADAETAPTGGPGAPDPGTGPGDADRSRPPGSAPAPTATTGPLPEASQPSRRRPDDAGLTVALGRWSRTGVLADVVAGWSPARRERCLRAVARAAPGTGGAGTVWEPAALARVLTRTGGTSAARSLDPVGRALLVLGVLAAAGSRSPSAGEVAEVVRLAGVRDPAPPHAAAPGATDREAGPAPPRPGPGGHAARGDAAAPPSPPAAGPAPASRGGAVVVPALPLLVVLQLQRLGHLEPAAAVLALHADPVAPGGRPGPGVEAARALAAMLAGKTLPPPRHGWLRAPAEQDAVARAAGVARGEVDGLLHRWRAPAEAAAPALDALLAALSEHDPARSASAGAALSVRRGLPGRGAEECERHLAAVVGTALDSLAVELWGAEADALLALERLADLEARVLVTGREVAVGLPRGQRWLDLRRAGLLDCWEVPWAPTGRWELVTW